MHHIIIIEVVVVVVVVICSSSWRHHSSRYISRRTGPDASALAARTPSTASLAMCTLASPTRASMLAAALVRVVTIVVGTVPRPIVLRHPAATA